MEYLNKWVVVKRYPNAQNNYIGKIQCLFIVKETANQVYGTETDDPHVHWRYQYRKSEVVRVIDKSERDVILRAQMHVRNNYRKCIEELQNSCSKVIDGIAEGRIK